MRVDFISNHLQQKNHQNFKSKLPSVNATYNINKVRSNFIPDYRPTLTLEHLKSRESLPTFKQLLTDLYNNFDNNILSLSCIKKGTSSESMSNEFVFRLYKNTDEFLKDSKSLKDFYQSKNYLNYEITIRKNTWGGNNHYNLKAGGTSIQYYHKDEVSLLTDILKNIITPETTEHEAIYNTPNKWKEEMFLKDFREQ